MDQIQNTILQMVQASAGRQPAMKQPGSEKEDFRKLMEQQAAGQNPAEAPRGDVPQDGEAMEAIEDPKLQEQMMLAAAAMLQNPVVIQTEEPIAAEEQVLQTVELQPVAEFTAQPEEAPAVQQELPVKTEMMADEIPQMRQASETFTQSVEAAQAPEQAAEAPVVQKVQTAESGADVQDSGDQENLEAGGEAAVFQEVREIPVKVGEAPAAEKPVEAQPVEVQIGEQLTEALKSGETRVEIQLAPESLGKVTIEVTLNQEGALHIILHAENPETRSLLARDAGSLQMMLARDTQQEVRVEIPQQQENHSIYDQQHQRGQHQNPQQHQRRQERREDAEDFLHQLRLGLIPVDGE